MSLDTLLHELRSLGVRIVVENHTLRVEAPKGALTSELQDSIRARKEELLRVLGDGDGAVGGPELERSEDSAPAPLSHAQERLWLFQELDPDATAYNLTPVVRLSGPLDLPRLEEALRRLVQRHEPLRTVFAQERGEVFLKVLDDPPVSIVVEDNRGVPQRERRETLRGILHREQSRPFDLATEPALRATLARWGDGEHDLIVAVHHILMDGTSIQIFFEDLIRLYGGEALPSLRVHYTDYTRWERDWWSGPRRDAEIDYWREHLKGAPLVLDLPTDRPRPARQSFTGGLVSWRLAEEHAERLTGLIRGENVSLFMALLAALASGLHRQTGQRDLIIGSPVSGRTRPELEGLIGMFVNTLPLRMRVKRGGTFRELLRAARSTAIEGFQHQDIPFALVAGGLDVPRDTSRTPVFQVMLNVLPPSAGEIVREGGPVTCESPDAQELASIFDRQSAFDLTLYGRQLDGRVQLELLYNEDLFDRDRALQILDGVREALIEGAQDPDTPLDEVLDRCRPTKPPFPLRRDGVTSGPSRTVVERFAAIAAERAADVALAGAGATWTYEQLLLEAERLARVIVGATSDPSTPVGVLHPHGPSAIASILAAFLSGRPYVPLDPNYPEERLAFMVRDSGLDLILAAPSLRKQAESILRNRGEVVTPDQAPRPDIVLPDPPRPESLAYLLYTSGSTGRPKAVMQSHGNLLYQAERYVEVLSLGKYDRVAWMASVSFDASLMDIFGGLSSGAVVVPIDPRAIDLSELPAHLEAGQISILHLTPTVFRTLARFADDSAFPSIRAVVLGGERVRVEDVVFFDERFPSEAVLLNLYGASEHSFSLGHLIDRRCRSTEIALGWPVGDADVLLLDENGEADPVLGELTIASERSALGYWNAPELTERVFADSLDRPGTTVYRTGDIARRRPDGGYVFLHRVDDQLKIRGHRVEPHEIEVVLKGHPAVVDVAVHAPTGTHGDAVLVGCVVLDGADVPNAELSEWCADVLPGFMIPRAWVVLDQLPRTPSGKIDRRALPTSDDGRSGVGRVAPRNAEEEVLAEIWSDVLGRDAVGVHDDFFELGGHSLTATQVVARARDTLGAEITLRQFFDAPTIADTATWLRRGAADEATLKPPIPSGADGPAPLSFSQERMWFLQMLDPDGVAYNIAGAMMFEGPLDVDRLSAAIGHVAERQESLRTRIEIKHGRPHQVVDPAPTHELRIEDCSSVDEALRLEHATRCAVELLEEPYDLASGPLLRVAIFRLDAHRHLLAVGMHHIVSDMWSYGIMSQEMTAAYNGAPALPELDLTYRDYSVWQRGWLAEEALTRQLEYWSEQLRDPPTLELPADFPRPRFFDFRGGRVYVELPAELREGLQELAGRSRATPFMAYLSAFYALLFAYSRRTDLAVGVPIANRTQTATEGLIGTFVNTLVHRNDLSGDPSFRELLERVRETALDAYAHQDAPFEMIVKALDPERDTSRPPIFQALFNVANVRVSGGDLEGARGTVIPLPRRTAQFDLTVNVGLNELQSDVTFGYYGAVYSRETVERWVAHYLDILERIVEDPGVPLSELSEISSRDRELVLDAWNRTERPYSEEAALPMLLESTAQRVPDRLAVRSPTGDWTYAELLEAAQRVSAALTAMGIGAGDRVIILMERSREMLAALLGVLGSGAAYVPMDPTYPEARVRYIVESSRAAAVVTHRGLDRRFGIEVPILDLDRWSPPPPADFRATGPEDAAYVIYTSGSTGQPKGVEVPHRAVLNFLHSMAAEPGITEDDILLAVTTISFDIAVLELYLPLVAGACVVIAGEDEVIDGGSLARKLEGEEATCMQATPATWKLLISAGWVGKSDLRVLCGGEALPPELADDLLDRTAEVWNMYGPTETTVWSAVERVAADEPISIGRPIANTTVYVLDDRMTPVPIGVPGELWIGGAGVTKGYFGRPDLTADRFLDSPFREGERIYRTGDLVRYRNDGRLEHLGRLDHQVKVRGYRIELGEIESVLRAHPGVRDAVAVARDERIVAYLIHELEAPTVGELRAWLTDRLPQYMIPSFFVPIEAFPLTPNGKVDRKSLPDPGAAAPDLSAFQPPTTPDELVLAEVWGELLSIERIGRADNFFELGGHSLLAMEAVTVVEERTGHRLEPRSLFFKTLGQLAEALRS